MPVQRQEVEVEVVAEEEEEGAEWEEVVDSGLETGWYGINYLLSSKGDNFQSCTICLQPWSWNSSSLVNVWMHVCLIWPHSCFSFIYYIYVYLH